MIIVMTLQQYNGALLAGPDLVSRGFVYVKESDALMEEARLVAEDTLVDCLERGADWNRIKSALKDALSEFIWKKTKRRPMILPIIQEV